MLRLLFKLENQMICREQFNLYQMIYTESRKINKMLATCGHIANKLRTPEPDYFIYFYTQIQYTSTLDQKLTLYHIVFYSKNS